ncbi:MAG: hypothetical protein HHJ12_01460 [Glaciimonas sp.]|nr:hypothetical protein [Glaciimonas sp.]
MARIIFLLGFITVLWLPLVQMRYGFFNETPLAENRKLAPLPELSGWRHLDRSAKDGIKWFDDHFGFRDTLIRAKTQIDYSVLGISSRIHIGTDGWLFYRSVMDVEKPATELMLRGAGEGGSASNSDAVVAGARALAGKLAARGVQLIVMVAPMKDVYYGSHLPRTARQLPQPQQITLLQQRLQQIPGLMYLDSAPILRQVAQSRTVFHRTDFHWNAPAAFAVSQALVNRLGQREGHAQPVWQHTLEIERRAFSGGEASFMPLFFPPTEQGLFVRKNWVEPAHHVVRKQAPFEWIYVSEQPQAAPLGTMVVLGDSFFDAMEESGTQIYFSKLYRARASDANLDSVLAALPSDTRYFLLEFIEVSNAAMMNLAQQAK